MPFTQGPVLVYAGAGRYMTSGVTEYVGGSDRFRIGDGFPTDLASVPRIFWALLPPHGVYEQAAVLHDWLCVELAAARRGRRPPMVSSRDTDGLFRRVAREGGAGLVVRWLLWVGVRWGALVNPARRAGWWRDAPAVLALTTCGVVVLATLLGVRAAVDQLLELL
jgi:hypothetical protein